MHSETDRELKKIYERFANSEKPVQKAYIESIHALVNLTEARDPYTKRHAVKVAAHAVALAKKRKLPKKDIETIKLAAILHDIGKLGIKEEVLLKNGSLNGEEYSEVKKHSEIGAEIVKPFKFFSEVISSIKHHHENYDGTGYPDGLKGEEIPLGARILAIVDNYDALISQRAYRKAYGFREALMIMKKESGKKFDPALFRAFISALPAKEKAGIGWI